jgi:hypothetical protein
MPGRAAALAKLPLSHLHAVRHRECLFEVVKEQCCHHPLVWVAGPPGASKTALIASYLTEHKQRTLWYQNLPAESALHNVLPVALAEFSAQMDLRGTEIVVLSVYDTDVGEVQEVQNGEGVYGLRRT